MYVCMCVCVCVCACVRVCVRACVRACVCRIGISVQREITHSPTMFREPSIMRTYPLFYFRDHYLQSGRQKSYM